jgi:hypothetical protein
LCSTPRRRDGTHDVGAAGDRHRGERLQPLLVHAQAHERGHQDRAQRPHRAVVDLDDHRADARGRYRHEPFGADLGDQPGHGPHEVCVDPVGVGAGHHLRVGAHRVGHGALVRARLGGDQPQERGGQPGQR